MNNTTVVNRDGKTYLTFHQTDIVIVHKGGQLEFNSGGYETTTTKKRMNDFQDVVRIFQKDYAWFAKSSAGTFKFFDGIKFDSDGNFIV